MKKRPRALLFAIDGADWAVIDPLIRAEKMPNLARLILKGTRANLKTLTPTESPRIWTSIATGTTPEKHGIREFIVNIPGTNKTTLPTSNLRKKAAFWNILSSSEYSVGVVGWWATYPAEEVNGFIISDHANHNRKGLLKKCLELTDESLNAEEPGETYPNHLFTEIEPVIRRAFQADDARLNRFVSLDDSELERLKSFTTMSRDEALSVLKYVFIYDESFRNSALYALDKFRPQLLAVFLAGVDGVEHHFWRFREPERFPDVPTDLVVRYGPAIDNYYAYWDETLGSFMERYTDDDLIIVLSDHGHGPNPDYGTDRARGYGKIASGTHEHGPDGILVAAGPGIKDGARLSDASVLDIAPTLLALNGIPVGEDMDGKVLTGLCHERFWEENPVKFIKSHSTDGMGDSQPVESVADEEMKNKLRALGYIE